mmetsp:Transcript_21720/g.68791  ORF Transcript_21720/g.68791 Transcript_21720/m.68791 type:complete len:206 (+) Transcript_21720:367-984(+)
MPLSGTGNSRPPAAARRAQRQAWPWQRPARPWQRPALRQGPQRTPHPKWRSCRRRAAPSPRAFPKRPAQNFALALHPEALPRTQGALPLQPRSPRRPSSWAAPASPAQAHRGHGPPRNRQGQPQRPQSRLRSARGSPCRRRGPWRPWRRRPPDGRRTAWAPRRPPHRRARRGQGPWEWRWQPTPHISARQKRWGSVVPATAGHPR